MTAPEELKQLAGTPLPPATGQKGGGDSWGHLEPRGGHETKSQAENDKARWRNPWFLIHGVTTPVEDEN